MSGVAETDTADHQRCDECGARGCTTVYDELLALEFTMTPPFAAWHAITVAAYGVQHPSRSGAAARAGQWRFLQVLVADGLPAVDRLAARRRAANSHRYGGLRDDPPDAGAGDVPVPPAGTATVRDVLGPDDTLDADGHDQRMLAWAGDLVARTADLPR